MLPRHWAYTRSRGTRMSLSRHLCRADLYPSSLELYAPVPNQPPYRQVPCQDRAAASCGNNGHVSAGLHALNYCKPLATKASSRARQNTGSEPCAACARRLGASSVHMRIMQPSHTSYCSSHCKQSVDLVWPPSFVSRMVHGAHNRGLRSIDSDPRKVQTYHVDRDS